MEQRYEVVAGNIGSVEFSRYNEAMEDFNTYVQDSKNCYGRVSQEDVTMFVDGEPYREFIWRDWRIEQQRAECHSLRTDFEKSLIILNRFLSQGEGS